MNMDFFLDGHLNEVRFFLCGGLKSKLLDIRAPGVQDCVSNISIVSMLEFTTH